MEKFEVLVLNENLFIIFQSKVQNKISKNCNGRTCLLKKKIKLNIME